MPPYKTGLLKRKISGQANDNETDVSGIRPSVFSYLLLVILHINYNNIIAES